MSGRLFLLGVDGLQPGALERFVGEGLMPNCRRLLDRAARLDVVPTLPALTAPGWLTIASGAHPGTLGVSNILLPTPGASPDTVRNGFDRRLSRGEYLWEVLADEGRRAIVLKYPGSWPPRPRPGLVQVDGAGGYADITCRFEEVASATYLAGIEVPDVAADGCCAVPRGYDEHWRIDSATSSGAVTVVPREPLDWSGVPGDAVPVFEAVLAVRTARRKRRTTLHLLAVERDGAAQALVSPTKRWDDAVAILAAGQWSGWIPEGEAERSCAYRLKLLELDLAQRRLRLYRSEGHRSNGFSVPEGVAGELVERVGPVVEWTGTFDYFNHLIDLDTQLEIYDQHTAWLEQAIAVLAERPWDGFFTHWHVVEYAHHIGGAALDPAHPLHDAGRERGLAFLRGTYRLLDRLVGAVDDLLASDDVLALVSDHGHDLVHTLFFVNDFLREQGWLTLRERADGHAVDWDKTRAYGLFPGLVVLNRSDWWEGGIVDGREAERLRTEISDALRLLVDPRTGRPLVDAVLGRDEMAAYGQFGPTAPDLFFTMDKGYEPATRVRGAGMPIFELTQPGTELTSGHGSFHPTSRSARTWALVRAAGLRGGARARYPVAMVDLAPTFARMLGVRRPRGCDGRPLDFDRLGVREEGSLR